MTAGETSREMFVRLAREGKLHCSNEEAVAIYDACCVQERELSRIRAAMYGVTLPSALCADRATA